jgi:hypothetical protein
VPTSVPSQLPTRFSTATANATLGGPPTDWGKLLQVHDDRDIYQASPNELPAIDIHSL